MDLNDLTKEHTNRYVEHRAREIEAFILAQLRVSDLNPIDVVLVERGSVDHMSTVFSVELKGNT